MPLVQPWSQDMPWAPLETGLHTTCHVGGSRAPCCILGQKCLLPSKPAEGSCSVGGRSRLCFCGSVATAGCPLDPHIEGLSL